MCARQAKELRFFGSRRTSLLLWAVLSREKRSRSSENSIFRFAGRWPWSRLRWLRVRERDKRKRRKKKKKRRSRFLAQLLRKGVYQRRIGYNGRVWEMQLPWRKYYKSASRLASFLEPIRRRPACSPRSARQYKFFGGPSTFHLGLFGGSVYNRERNSTSPQARFLFGLLKAATVR